MQTGCLLGLGTNPDRLLGLGTHFYYKLMILGPTPIFAMFSMSSVCVVRTFVSYFMLYFCIHSRVFELVVFKPYFINMHKAFL